MKRNRKLKYQDRICEVEITVRIKTVPRYLLREQVEAMSEDVCEGIMKVLGNAKHIYAPLTQIKVQ